MRGATRWVLLVIGGAGCLGEINPPRPIDAATEPDAAAMPDGPLAADAEPVPDGPSVDDAPPPVDAPPAIDAVPPADAGICPGQPAGTVCAEDGVCDGDGHCLITLAAGQTHPNSITVAAGFVYWTTAGTGPSAGTVMRCAATGCDDTPTVIATAQPSLRDVAADSSYVYFVNGVSGAGTPGEGRVVKCPVDGCGPTPEVLAIGIQPDAIVVDATTVYWCNVGSGGESIHSCAIGGCGGAPTSLAPVSGTPTSIAVSATTLAWTVTPLGGGTGGGVISCATGACVPAGLATSTTMTPISVALGPTHAYWTSSDRTVKVCALAGCDGSPSTLGALGPTVQPGAAATDGADVYFVVLPDPGSLAPPAIQRCAVGGCAFSPTTVATGPAVVAPSAIAVDATSVYWTDAATGTVMKVAK